MIGPLRPAAVAVALAICLPQAAAAHDLTHGDDHHVERREAPARSPRETIRLAQEWLERAKRDGDARYEGEVEALLASWASDEHPPLAVLLLRASLASHRHDFRAAKVDLERVLARSPGQPQALLSLAFVHLTTGAPAAAARACGGLPERPYPMVRAACLAAVGRLGPDPGAAYAELRAAMSRPPIAPASLRRWGMTILGELAAQRGDPAAAELHYERALDLDGPSSYLLGAFADLLLDQKRPAEVEGLLGNETRNGAMLLRLAIADRRLGAPDATRVERLRAWFEAEHQRGAAVHLRERARFKLDALGDPVGALDDARANWRTQREPVDARLVLEAALASGSSEGAAEVLEWMARTGIHDVRLEPLATRLRQSS